VVTLKNFSLVSIQFKFRVRKHRFFCFAAKSFIKRRTYCLQFLVLLPTHLILQASHYPPTSFFKRLIAHPSHSSSVSLPTHLILRASHYPPTSFFMHLITHPSHSSSVSLPTHLILEASHYPPISLPNSVITLMFKIV
jgi:hypothetical protein